MSGRSVIDVGVHDSSLGRCLHNVAADPLTCLSAAMMSLLLSTRKRLGEIARFRNLPTSPNESPLHQTKSIFSFISFLDSLKNSIV